MIRGGKEKEGRKKIDKAFNINRDGTFIEQNENRAQSVTLV